MWWYKYIEKKKGKKKEKEKKSKIFNEIKRQTEGFISNRIKVLVELQIPMDFIASLLS